MRWPLRYQLLLPLLVLVLGVAGVAWWQASAAAAQAREAIEQRVQKVAHFLSQAPNVSLDRIVLDWMKLLTEADFLVVPPQGEWQTTLAARPAASDLPPLDAPDGDWRNLHLGPPVAIGGRRYLCTALGLKPPRKGEILYILFPESLLQDALREATQPVAILGSFAAVAAVALALGLGQRLGRRVHELERQTRRIAAGDFSPLPVPGTDDEIRDLTVSINEMAQRLARFQESALRSERLRLLGQVGGGLAHQLRNGLTGARLALQLFLREVAGTVETAALDVALRQLTLLEAHLQRFLQLGRTENLRREPLALAEVIDEAVGLVEPRSRHAGIELVWRRPTEPTGPDVAGDTGQLGQVLLNLLGNALDAAGAGGSVEVRLRRTGNRVVLEVLDSGPGPPTEVAGRLFEPFVTSKPEGVGLGLAVAREVVEAHGGRIAWHREGERTCFRIELPTLEETFAERRGP